MRVFSLGKQRLDLLLVERGFYATRQQAQRAIRAGSVLVADARIDKPGTEVPTDAKIEARQPDRFVSRGGEKLVKAFTAFDLDVRDRDCLDAGISTGGFTDCLLQAGARRVYGIDVGYGQVAWKLRQDARVILRERTNLRHLQPQDLYCEGDPIPTFACADLSFISLSKVLVPLWQLLAPPREVVFLVKPQFEVGRGRVGKKGVVRDPQDRASAIAAIIRAAGASCRWYYRGLTWSPLTGPAGNIEYLLWMSAVPQGSPPSSPPGLEEIGALDRAAVESLSRPGVET